MRALGVGARRPTFAVAALVPGAVLAVRRGGTAPEAPAAAAARSGGSARGCLAVAAGEGLEPLRARDPHCPGRV
ncbi:MAG TPA: hypothetical protein VEB43_07835 [Anaeromyxobacter sp.]|nr:hypothetical protein [Anaeromyxobacter sp.]